MFWGQTAGPEPTVSSLVTAAGSRQDSWRTGQRTWACARKAVAWCIWYCQSTGTGQPSAHWQGSGGGLRASGQTCPGCGCALEPRRVSEHLSALALLMRREHASRWPDCANYGLPDVGGCGCGEGVGNWCHVPERWTSPDQSNSLSFQQALGATTHSRRGPAVGSAGHTGTLGGC